MYLNKGPSGGGKRMRENGRASPSKNGHIPSPRLPLRVFRDNMPPSISLLFTWPIGDDVGWQVGVLAVNT